MSHFNQVRKYADEASLIKELSEKLARSEARVNRIENSDAVRRLRQNHDRIKYDTSIFQTEITSTDPSTLRYYLPLEPDGVRLRLWYRFNDFQPSLVRDSANNFNGYNREGAVFGNPVSVQGRAKINTALLFDGLDDFVYAPFTDSSLSQNNFATGFSIQFNVLIPTFAVPEEMYPRLCTKLDTDDGLNGWACFFSPSQKHLYFVVRKNSSTGVMRTYPNAFTQTNTWYTVQLTYNTATNTPDIYVDKVKSTTATTSGAGIAMPYFVNHGFFIAGVNYTNKGAKANVAIGDWRFWGEKVLTQTEINAWHDNQYTITDITAGQVAIVGHWWLGTDDITPPDPTPPPTPSTLISFMDNAFASDSFI